ncbi:unnamed protein product [Closterium sp. NIES-64]|nr:unnamed protein product [Closterium sp. NIES-64]
MANQATATWGFDDSVLYGAMRLSDIRSRREPLLEIPFCCCPLRRGISTPIQKDGVPAFRVNVGASRVFSAPSLPAHAQQFNKNPQPDKLMDGVEQLVDEYDIEQVASAPQLSADDVAAGELSLDCNRFLIGRSMINDRVSDHEEGITWLRSAPRLLWVARERRAEADAAERQRRREK